jgi:hypothetical protein
MDCKPNWNRKLVMKQGKMIGISGSTIRLLSIQTLSSSLAVCAKKQFYLQNERKQTRLDCY